jgi:hypothetical protein
MAFYGISERDYRERLFREFSDFCRRNQAWVISPSHQGQARVQVAEGSPLVELLAQWPRYPVVKTQNVSHRLQGGRFIPVTEIQVSLWR